MYIFYNRRQRGLSSLFTHIQNYSLLTTFLYGHCSENVAIAMHTTATMINCSATPGFDTKTPIAIIPASGLLTLTSNKLKEKNNTAAKSCTAITTRATTRVNNDNLYNYFHEKIPFSVDLLNYDATLNYYEL